MDLPGGGEEVEDERDSEEGGEEKEPSSLGLEGLFGAGWRWRKEVHPRVELCAVGRDVGGGRPGLEAGHLHWLPHCFPLVQG